MAAASPTPLPAYGNDRLSRQTSRRQLSRIQPSRATLRRNSPLSIFRNSNGFGAGVEGLQNISVGDSSDDEAFPVLKLSAASRAILGDAGSLIDPSPARGHVYRDEHGKTGRTPSRAGHLRIYRQSSPSVLGQERRSPPRVFQVTSDGLGSAKLHRKLSMSGRYPDTRQSRETTPHQLITPAFALRGVGPSLWRSRSVASAHGSTSRPGSAEPNTAREPDDLKYLPLSLRDRTGSSEKDSLPQDAPTAHRSRVVEEAAVMGSIRVKRVLMGTGTFLRGKPMRRPLRRQLSDGHSPDYEEVQASARPASARQEDDHRPASGNGSASVKSCNVSVHDFADHGRVDAEGQIQKRQAQNDHQRGAEAALAPVTKLPSTIIPPFEHIHTTPQLQFKPPPEPLLFKVPPLPPALPSVHDQENEVPPTFRKSKPHASLVHDLNENKILADTPVLITASPKRPALIRLSQNTPHRPAPPPPKMSIIETATAKAGASTAKAKKRRSHFTVNGQSYSVLDILGRGGSAKVYHVLAPNNKRFALKKVNLEGIDEQAISGYKGEIELLKKLAKCERVVDLIDWEVSEERMSLSIVLEIGDSDLTRIVDPKLSGSAEVPPRLDLPFVRHIWKEILECIEAVHAYDVVHSDLKPANFLMVKGRLKLIDFGIANAIDIDHTVNVHRENNVGTPNYMSPESLIDQNDGLRSSQKLQGQARGPKLMKLGKPSDIWSAGCILYQLVYGKPPFAYIANQLQRILAITNPAVEIVYPDNGLGGAYVPIALKRTLKQCLSRDQMQRPTAAQLLEERNAWLYPEAAERVCDPKREQRGSGRCQGGAAMMDAEMLGRILINVVERCRDPKRGCPTDEEVRGYPEQFLAKIRAMMEDPGWDR